MTRIFIATMMLASLFTYAQQPSQKEMAEYNKMMKDTNLQKTLNKMGIKMGSGQDVQQQLNFASAHTGTQQKNEAMGIATLPLKDMARISGISKKILTTSELISHIRQTTAAVENHLSRGVRDACGQVYKNIKEKNAGENAVANAACGSWMMGYMELGLYLMGRACAEQPGVADNLNNYSAFLVMAGGEQYALPILFKLNADYPGNSTILNNIGQAWYGLGDISTAEKYLDTAIRIFPGHAQANLTKSNIKEVRGDKRGAAGNLKASMEQSYSADKDSKLRKLGYPPEDSQVGWPGFLPEDPLGLHLMSPPSYWFSIEDEKAQQTNWDKWQKDLRDKIDLLSARLTAARSSLAKAASVPVTSPYTARAQKKLDALMETMNLKPIYAGPVWQKMYADFTTRVQALHITLSVQLAKVSKDFADRFGEGKEYPAKAFCDAQRGPINQYLSQVNTLADQFRSSTLEENRRFYNQLAYFSEYTQNDALFTLTKLDIQLKYLGLLSFYYPFAHPDGIECQLPPKEKSPYGKLSDFDDIHCQYKTSLDVNGIGKISVECNKMTTIFEPTFLPVKGRFTEDLNSGNISNASVGATYKFVSVNANFENGQFTKGSVDVGKDINIGKTGTGPLEIGAKGKAGVSLEFDRNGLSDLVLKGDVKVTGNLKGVQLDNTVKTDVGDVKVPVPDHSSSVTIDINSRFGVNAGGSLTSKGTLSGMGSK